MEKFAEVILPLPLPGSYTYSIPKELEDRVVTGCRVSVPHAGKKTSTALVVGVHGNRPEGYKIKAIKELLDDEQKYNEFADKCLKASVSSRASFGSVDKDGNPKEKVFEMDTYAKLRRMFTKMLGATKMSRIAITSA